MNTAAVNRSVETVDHSAPREATAATTLTRRRFPVTRTTGVRPSNAQGQPGGAAPERNPHWPTHAITANSTSARLDRRVARVEPGAHRSGLRSVMSTPTTSRINSTTA